MRVIQTDEDFVKAIRVLDQAETIALDTETYWDSADLMGCSTHVRGDITDSFYFPFFHNHDPELFRDDPNLSEIKLERLGEVLGHEKHTLLFHNAKFDLGVFARAGIDLQNRFYCTQIMSHMSDENSTHALKPLSELLFQDDSRKEEKFMKDLRRVLPWHKTPPVVMGPYAIKDVELTYRLWEYLMVDLRKQDLLKLWPREEDFCRLLLAMETQGVLLDQEQAKLLAYRASVRMDEILAEIGFDPMKPSQLAHKLYTSPPEGLGFPLPELSKNRSTEFGSMPLMPKSLLKSYQHPDVNLALEYRGLQKALSTWFQGFLDLLGPDGRIHTTFRQDGTKTTRLSSQAPNMQNLPRTKEEEEEEFVNSALVKSMIAAPEGYEVWGLDYSQLEYRLMACYSGESDMIEAFNSGIDFHTLTAERVGLSRYYGKQLNFTIGYGGGATRVSNVFGVDFITAEEIVSAFWSSYPRLRRTVDQCTRAAQNKGFIRLWTGRKRHFQYPSEHRKAFNSLIQGGGAEIVKEAMLRIARSGCKNIISAVHDELWFEVEKGFDFEPIMKLMSWPNYEDPSWPVKFPIDKKLIADGG